MTHDPKTVLASLGPCASGYKFALGYNTFEEVLAAVTDPLWYLWFFLALSRPGRFKKAALVGALSGLFHELTLELAPETGEVLRPALEALQATALSGDVPPLFPTLAGDVLESASRTHTATQAVNLARAIQQALVFCQDGVTPEALNALAPQLYFGLLGSTAAAPVTLTLLRKYLTNPVWYAIEATT